ncbi:phosphoglycerate mutase family protein [Paenibacillus radicis (ex Xue et al. 2023)]|uniref:Histidine phosphatase family protein n=1 Tax=Paenibacillus radicis (ex Xue et al. 2023) TaxID=2972489 RepID=A0ABT1YAA8_9BACL|nr:phosphoglycerate mutase family protein [Paenibacillus radicis (ex Xue et al. 2023)]MCR8630112.1 histidine phosphatase family protein [Paenibacillus radicis (ex Xue et al. 2023)]
MEIIFIRHGQGVHNIDIPNRLNTENPRLTERGRDQVASLKSVFSFSEDSVYIASPTIRTIETTNIITSDLLLTKKYVSPLVGPRMFPIPQNPEAYVSKCDINYSLDKIISEHSDFIVLDKDNQELWNTGINTLTESAFEPLGLGLINWIKTLCTKKVFIIAHDGTITNYRILLGENGLSRSDFLGEAGWYKLEI